MLKCNVIWHFIIESVQLQAEYEIKKDIIIMCSAGFHENVVGLLKTCLSDCKLNTLCVRMYMHVHVCTCGYMCACTVCVCSLN